MNDIAIQAPETVQVYPVLERCGKPGFTFVTGSEPTGIELVDEVVLAR
jgi:hypothetical protein